MLIKKASLIQAFKIALYDMSKRQLGISFFLQKKKYRDIMRHRYTLCCLFGFCECVCVWFFFFFWQMRIAIATTFYDQRQNKKNSCW